MSEAVKHMWQKIVIVVLLLFLVWGKCGGTVEPQDINVVTYTDTTYSTHIDTIEFIDTIYKTKTKLLYTYIDEIPEDSSKLYTFETYLNDSLLDGDLSTKIKVKDDSAMLISQNFNYTPKFPKYIYQTDSVFIHDSTVTTIYDTKPKLMVGLDIVFGNATKQGTIMPNIGLELRGNTILEAGYDPFNKQVMIGAKYKLIFKQKSKNAILFR